MMPPRSAEERKADALARLETDIDVWVATAGEAGAHLVPFSLDWDGEAVILATETRSRTVSNLLQSPAARLALGTTRDVVLIEATAARMDPASDVSGEVAEHFAARVRWDPRDDQGDFSYIRFEPQVIRAWREANEIAGRTIMRGGQWLV